MCHLVYHNNIQVTHIFFEMLSLFTHFITENFFFGDKKQQQQFMIDPTNKQTRQNRHKKDKRRQQQQQNRGQINI